LPGAISPAGGLGHKIDMPKTDRLTSHIRLSPALKRRLKVAAAENGRSLNEEVVLRLEGSFEVNSSQRGRLKELLGAALSELDGDSPS